MSIHTGIGELGATRQTWRSRTVRELVAELVAEHPNASEAKLLREYIARCQADEDDMVAALTYAFDNNYRSFRKHAASVEEKAHRAVEKVKVAQAAARVAQKHAEAVKNIKAQVMLLNLPMPNGKLMRYCTGEEMAAFGKAYTKIAQKAGRKQVGEVLSEQELHKLLD